MFFYWHRSAADRCLSAGKEIYMTLKAWIMIALAVAIVAGNIILIVRGRRKK